VTIALDMLDRRDDAVALACPTFSTRGRDGVEMLSKGHGTSRGEPLSSPLWSSHECLVWRQELPDCA
jgi:hypothetical protein